MFAGDLGMALVEPGIYRIIDGRSSDWCQHDWTPWVYRPGWTDYLDGSPMQRSHTMDRTCRICRCGQHIGTERPK
jgi:hypothetical protein